MLSRSPILTALSIALAALLLIPDSAFAQLRQLQYQRARSQDGINQFEAPNTTDIAYDGFVLDWGAAFAQQFQGLTHDNAAIADPDGDGEAENALSEIGPGFNLATANLYLGAQLADGISVNLTTYLSSRNHPEAWVKGGYLQVNKLPFATSESIDNLMDLVTVKVGHFEINYGDMHFRRTDNGNALYNPFVGNYIIDAFNTEIGAEVYVRPGNFLLMGAITGGEIRGAVDRPDDRAPAFYGKVGYDGQVTPQVRFRLTGSAYTTNKSLNNTLLQGDRAGSRFYSVIGGSDWSGRIRPGMRSEVTAFTVNPFVQIAGFEVFATLEWISGRAANEPDTRDITQYGVEAIYRFLNDDVYLGGRYNIVDGELESLGNEVSVDRIEVGGGWFVTGNMLLKATYVAQNYSDYANTSVFHEGQFDGFMVEAVVVF